MDNLNKNFDYIIIGGGFSGLFLKKLLEKNSIDHLLIENQLLGGQLNLYLNKYIYDIPGILKISGQELLDQLMPQDNFLENCYGTSIENHGDYKTIECLYNHKPITLKCKKIIFTGGKGSVKPIKFPYEGLDLLESLGKVHYALHSNQNYGNKTIAVLGGGDSALDAVDLILSQGGTTHLIHRRNLTAMAGKIEKIQNNHNNTMVLNSTIEKFSYDDDQDKVIIYITGLDPVVVDEVFIFYGVLTDHSTINKILESNGKIPVDYDSLKAHHGLIDFAIGDVSTYVHKRFLIHNYMAECYRLLNFIQNKD